MHPVQLYEAAGNLLIFFILNFLLSNRRSAGRGGRVLAAYAALYALLRFSVEFFRGDDRGGFMLGLSPAQIISLTVFISVVLYSLTWKVAKEQKDKGTKL
jgi:phosphatidylglycerol:prolipoprotein diacylglycerol transferase